MGKLPVYTPYQPSHALPAPRERTAPRVPFFEDPRHTVPTKWSLYRPLLRALKGPAGVRAQVPAAAIAVAAAAALAESRAPVALDPTVHEARAAEKRLGRGRKAPGTTTEPPPPPTASAPTAAYPFLLDAVRARWRLARDLTGIPAAREFIISEMGVLERVRAGTDDTLETKATALAAQVAIKLRSEANAAAKLAAAKARPPFLTGGFMRGSLFNVPMPRMKPQPARISITIRKRALRRTRRIAKDRRADDEIEDMRREIAFWRRLGIDDAAGLGDWSSSRTSWETEYLRYKRELSAQFDAEVARGNMQFTDEQMAAVKEARRRRHRYRVNSAREMAGLGPLFDTEGNRIEGAEGSVLPFDEARWRAAKARREAARR